MQCLPMITCPACKREAQWDDYYDICVGSSRQCQHCEAEIVVTEVDTQTWVRVMTTGSAPTGNG